MDTDHTFEQQIQAEIELLRAQFPQTQDLYREACVLLFFRFGITPTANKLYQFVRKGSMSAPAEALAKFWEGLREKSRVRIEHPDLPEDLRTAAGDLTAALWSKAQAHAQQGLAIFLSEAQSTVLEANAALSAAEAERDKARSEIAAAQESHATATARILDVERQLAAESATRAMLETQLYQAAQDFERFRVAHDEARRDFAIELEKHRASAQLADDRFRATEERALREIDRERTQVVNLQMKLDQVRSDAAQAMDRYQAEVSALHADAGQLRQRIGILEGNLDAAQSERSRISVDAESLRHQLTEMTCQAAGYRASADNWQCRTEEAQRRINDLQAKTGRRPRKANTDNRDLKGV